MSLSLMAIVVGLPVALTARVVMGEEKFNQWIRSSENVLYTNFSSMDEMKKIVCQAGYDVVPYFNSPKTHLKKNSSAWFLWEIRDGQVAAILSKYDDKAAIQKFISAVEETAGQKVFKGLAAKQKDILSDSNGKTVLIEQQIPTVFTDEGLLKQVLEKFNLPVVYESAGNIQSQFGDLQVLFTRDVGEAYDLQIQGPERAMKSFYDCLFAMNEEYGLSIQEQTYLHVLANLEDAGMTLLEENVLEDNSIMLTLQVEN